MREKFIKAVQIILICLGVVKTTWKKKPGMGYETCGVRMWNPISWIWMGIATIIVAVEGAIVSIISLWKGAI